MRLRVAGLYCRPLKGAQGFQTDTLRFGHWGPEWNHVFLIVDATGEFVTQRSAEGKGIAIKQMCLVRATFNGGWTHLLLDAPDMPTLKVSLYDQGRPQVPIRIWDHATAARDMGPTASEWVTRFLTQYRPGVYRLVRMIEPRPTDDGSALTAFTDGYQALVVHEASLRDLNARVRRRQAQEGEPIDPVGWDRIRPTIVLAGGLPGHQAYIEDRLGRVRMGQVVLVGETACTRCALTLINQESARSGKEPLRTLRTYRTGLRPGKPNVPCFGRNFNATTDGVICVGDRVSILRRQSYTY